MYEKVKASEIEVGDCLPNGTGYFKVMSKEITGPNKESVVITLEAHKNTTIIVEKDKTTL